MNSGNPKTVIPNILKEVGNNQLYSFVNELKLENKRLFLTPFRTCPANGGRMGGLLS